MTVPDDATRRQLRFALFLQGFAALMLGVALIVRVLAFGWDLVSTLFALGVAGVVAAIGLTWRRLRG